MPRSSSKSQASKGRHLSSVPVTPVPAQEPEIVPGRLTQTQWMNIVSQEETDDIVGEIVECALSTVMKDCLTVYIAQQLIPFTVAWAKEQFITTLEQQIICPDEGEGSEVSSATQDTEPFPTATDSWVEGCGPVLSVTQLPGPTLIQQEADFVRMPAQIMPKVDQQPSHSKSTRKQPEIDSSPSTPFPYQQHKERLPVPPTKVHPIVKKQLDLHMPVPIKLPAVQTTAVVKRHVEEAAGGLYVIYNKMAGPLIHSKSYTTIPRLKPSRLPRHSIFPQYEIVNSRKDDDDGAKPNPKKPIGRAKHEQMITRLMPPTISRVQPAMFQRSNGSDFFMKKLSPPGLRQRFSQSLKLDSKVLARGFPQQDPLADRNPLMCSTPTQSTKSRIVLTEMDVPQFSINQANAIRSPQATPLFLSKNGM